MQPDIYTVGLQTVHFPLFDYDILYKLMQSNADTSTSQSENYYKVDFISLDKASQIQFTLQGCYCSIIWYVNLQALF